MRPWLELLVVGVIAVGFVALPKPPASIWPLACFIAAAVVGGGTYFVYRVRTEGRAWLEESGFLPGRDVGALLTILVPLVALAAVGGAAWAWAHDQLVWSTSLGLSLLLYPFWGLVQQWVVQRLVVDNVRQVSGAKLPWLVLLGAVGFGVVHLAHPSLMIGTALLGGLYVVLFQRHRNLWPLGLVHGLLGSLFYPWVLGIDPLGELLVAVGLV